MIVRLPPDDNTAATKRSEAGCRLPEMTELKLSGCYCAREIMPAATDAGSFLPPEIVTPEI